jgi:hypothetical protein
MKTSDDTAGAHDGPPGRAADTDDETTGLPWLRSWLRVYLFVIGCFVTWVALLLALSLVFS